MVFNKEREQQKLEHAELLQKLSEEQEQYRRNDKCQEIKHLQLAKFVEAMMKSIMMETTTQAAEIDFTIFQI